MARRHINIRGRARRIGWIPGLVLVLAAWPRADGVANVLDRSEEAHVAQAPARAAPSSTDDDARRLWMSPAVPRAGELVMFEVDADDLESARLNVFGQDVDMFKVGDRLRGFVGVPLNYDRGPVNPKLKFYLDNEPTAAHYNCQAVQVTTRSFTFDALKVARGFANKRRIAPPRIGGPADDSLLIGFKPLGVATYSQTLFTWPKDGNVTAGFGVHRLFNSKMETRHLGVDIDGDVGDYIFAAQSGVVRMSGPHKSTGETIVIDHGGGVMTHYFHLSRRLKKVGDKIKQGELIGYVGRTGRVTGAHLHFSVSVHGRYVDPQQVLTHTMQAKNPVTCVPQIDIQS